MIDPLTHEEAAQIDEPPSLLGRAGEQLVNAPSTALGDLSKILFNVGLQDDRNTPVSFPKPYDVPAARTFGEAAIDFGADQVSAIPLIMAGEGVGAEAASLMRLGKFGSSLVRGATGFGAMGLPEGAEQTVKDTALGVATAGLFKLGGSLLKKKPKILLPEETPPIPIPAKQADATFPTKDTPTASEATANNPMPMPQPKSAAESANIIIGNTPRVFKPAQESADAILAAQAEQAPGRNLQERVASLQPTPATAEESANVFLRQNTDESLAHAESRLDTNGRQLRQKLDAESRTAAGLAPEGSLIRDARFSPNEALQIAGHPPLPPITAPEGSLIREPLVSEGEALTSSRVRSKLSPREIQIKAASRAGSRVEEGLPIPPEPEPPVATLQPEKPLGNKIVGPALVDHEGNVLLEGKIGDSHIKLMSRGMVEHPEKMEQIVDAFADDSKHVFVTDTGRVLDRQDGLRFAQEKGQAAAGLKELHSHHLTEPKPATPVIETPTMTKAELKVPKPKKEQKVKSDLAVATLQPEKPKAAKQKKAAKAAALPKSDTPSSPLEMVTWKDGEDTLTGRVVSHDTQTGIMEVKVGGDVLSVRANKVEPYKPSRMTAEREGEVVQQGGLNDFAKLEAETDKKKSGMKLRQKLPEVGEAPLRVAAAIAAFAAGGLVGGAISDDDHRMSMAITFAAAAAGLAVGSPRLFRAFAETHPEIMAEKSMAGRIKKVSLAAKDVVTANEKVATAASADYKSASGFDKITRWMSRNFSVDPAIVRIDDAAKGTINELSKVIEAGQRVLTNAKLNPYQRGLIGQFIRNKVDLKHFLGNINDDGVGQAVVGYQQSVRAMQQIFADSLPAGDLQKTVRDQLGQYVTKTYRLFHDPHYIPSEAKVMAAAQELSEDIHGDLQNRIAILRSYLAEQAIAKKMYGTRRAGSAFGESLGSAITLKDDLGPAFKDMLGEFDDPIEEMAATADKLTRASATAEFFNNVVKLEKENGLKYTYTTEAATREREIITRDIAIAHGAGDTEKVATLQSKLEDLNNYQYNPINPLHGKLSGTLVDRRVHDRLMTYDTINTQSTSGVIRAMSDATNMIKYGKTVLSPLQLVRQVVSMPLLGMMSKTHPGDWAKAFRSLQDPLERSRLNKLGILAGDQVAGMLKKDFSALLAGKWDAMASKNMALRGLHKWEELYRTPDLMVRVSAFQKEEARLLAAGKTADEAAQGGIDFANRYTMNYGAVPAGIQKFRKVPFVNQYLTFAYEALRITKNLAQDAFHKKDPYAMGVLTALATGPFVIQKLTEAQLSPEDRAKWEQVKNLGPSYSRSNFKFVTGKDEQGNFHYFDYTPILIHDKFLKMFRDIGAKDWAAFGADNPAFGWENTPLLNVATNQIAGKDIHTSKNLDTIGERIDSIRRDVLPPLLGTDLDRIVQALTPNAEGGLGIRDLQTGQSSSIASILGSYATSIREYTVAPAYLARRAVVDAQQQTANARAYLYRVSRSNATLQQKSSALAQYQTTQKQIMMQLRDTLRMAPPLQSQTE